MRNLWPACVLLAAATVAAEGCRAPPYNPPPYSPPPYTGPSYTGPPNPTTTTAATYNTGHGSNTTFTTSKTTTPPSCLTDACLEVLKATTSFFAGHQSAGCRSFLDTYYIITDHTNTFTTTTTTIIVTANSPLPSDKTPHPTTSSPTLQPRQASPSITTGVSMIPTAIPAYASACTDDVQYRSGCVCIGVTSRILTEYEAAQVWVTPTATATVLVQPTATYRPFILLTEIGALGDVDDPNTADYAAPWPQDEGATVFYYNPVTREVYADGFGPLYVYDTNAPASGPDDRTTYVFYGFQMPSWGDGFIMVPLTCDIDAGNNLLCDVDGLTRWGTDDRYFSFVLAGADYAFPTNRELGREVPAPKVVYLD